MVFATASPRKAPIKLATVARMIAARGVRTFVETTVAIALAVSWKPLMYSKARATSKTTRKSVIGKKASAAERARSGVLERHVENDAAGIAATIHPAFDQLVEILGKNQNPRIRVPVINAAQ